MTDYSDEFCGLIQVLAHNHAHEDAKKRAIIIQKKFENPLDFDEVEEVFEQASEELLFIMYRGGKIWLQQNRSLLEYIKNECGYDLWSISCRFDHIDPPSLREEYDLPPPTN